MQLRSKIIIVLLLTSLLSSFTYLNKSHILQVYSDLEGEVELQSLLGQGEEVELASVSPFSFAHVETSINSPATPNIPQVRQLPSECSRSDTECSDGQWCSFVSASTSNPICTETFTSTPSPKNWQQNHSALVSCLSTRRLLVFGDSTSKALWGPLLKWFSAPKQSDQLPLVPGEWNHDLVHVSRTYQSSSFHVWSQYFPHLHDYNGLKMRPFKSDVLNSLHNLWYAASKVPKPSGVRDIFLIGGFKTNWIEPIISWVQAHDSKVQKTTLVAMNDFVFLGYGSCHSNQGKTHSTTSRSLTECQSMCRQSKKMCTGLTFQSQNEEANCGLVFRMPVHAPRTNTQSTTIRCYSYHPGDRSLLRQYPLPFDVPIIFRSPSPFTVNTNETHIDQSQRSVAKNVKKDVQALGSSVNQHPIVFFDIFSRLLPIKEKGGYERIHWDKSRGVQEPDPTGAVSDKLANEFLELLCRV
eukprot:c4452_g1_i1.p1 GENE.c4452_g1_i1~~c4452_g1_i1.p1  ORF type:complete len:468 (+),score=56.12 c4452_g1_i1:41-1444(+)